MQPVPAAVTAAAPGGSVKHVNATEVNMQDDSRDIFYIEILIDEKHSTIRQFDIHNDGTWVGAQNHLGVR